MGEGVDIRVRTHGARAAARDVDRVGRSTGRLGSRARLASGGLRVFTRATTSATGGLRIMGGAAVYGGAALGGILFLGLKRSTDAYNESRKVTAMTAAGIRSTGGAANVTAAEVERLAGRLSRKTAMDDEAIQSGANVLLTFKKVRNEVGAGNDVFNRATQAALDLSARGFGSIDSASKGLGKALGDPVKGITALRRAGVDFTQAQKDQIASLVESGNILGAQRIILREVESQVGGSAAAQATATDRMKVSWENVQETIGKGLSPAVDALADKVDGFLTRAQPQIDAFGGRMARLFRDKDVPLDAKLQFATADLERTTRPVRRALGRELERLDIGDKLADGFDAAAPRIMQSLGRAAPKAVGAFVTAWWNSGVSGKLFTVALLSGKLGVFGALGSLAFRRFSRSWSRGRLPAPPVAPPVPVGGPGGRRAGLARAGAAVVPAVALGSAAKAGTDRLGVTGGSGEDVRKRWIDRHIPGMRQLRDLGVALGLEDPVRGGIRRATPGGAARARADSARRARVAAGPRRERHVYVYIDGKRVAAVLATGHGRDLARGVNRANADTRARK
jgi:hypothetical protein